MAVELKGLFENVTVRIDEIWKYDYCRTNVTVGKKE